MLGVSYDCLGLAHGWQQRATRSLCHLFPHWGAEENGKKKKAKLMGRDKGSLTEQQTKRRVTTIIPIRRIYKTKCEMHKVTRTTQCPTRS